MCFSLSSFPFRVFLCVSWLLSAQSIDGSGCWNRMRWSLAGVLCVCVDIFRSCFLWFVGHCYFIVVWLFACVGWMAYFSTTTSRRNKMYPAMHSIEVHVHVPTAATHERGRLYAVLYMCMRYVYVPCSCWMLRYCGSFWLLLLLSLFPSLLLCSTWLRHGIANVYINLFE